MRIGVYDPTGAGLGLALGLVDLGHQVTLEGPPAWTAADAPQFSALVGELARHSFGKGLRPIDAADCDLVVVADVFADFLAPLAPYLATDRRGLPSPPSFLLLYPERLRRALALAVGCQRAVVVDCSDCAGPREEVFAQIPHVIRLARECPLAGGDGWQPLPFLFNNVVLWMQRMLPESHWLVPQRSRRRSVDWAFCGTVEHPRYGERRWRTLAEVERRWPHLRGVVHTDVSFTEVVRAVQSSRMGLDLPGAGELCFRLHECLALGVPVWQPEPASIVRAPGLAGVVAERPEQLLGLGPDTVRAVCADHYSPQAAAASLLAAAQGGIGVGVAGSAPTPAFCVMA